MKKVYEFAAIPVLISSKMFLGFQYKVLHLLTEIRDGMENIGNLLKAENISINQIWKFGRLLQIRPIINRQSYGKEYCKGIYLHRAAPIKRPLKFPPPLNKRTHYAKKYKCPTRTPFLRRKI